MEILQNLSFDATVWIIQVVLFLVLWNVMSILFWKPYLSHLQSRDKQVADAYHSVEQTRHEMETLRTEYQARITQIENDARSRIQTAIKEAQTERERIVAEARAASDATMREGIAALEQEKVQALADLRERMVGLAVNAATKALGSSADATTLQRSVEERIVRVSGNGANAARN